MLLCNLLSLNKNIRLLLFGALGVGLGAHARAWRMGSASDYSDCQPPSFSTGLRFPPPRRAAARRLADTKDRLKEPRRLPRADSRRSELCQRPRRQLFQRTRLLLAPLA